MYLHCIGSKELLTQRIRNGEFRTMKSHTTVIELCPNTGL